MTNEEAIQRLKEEINEYMPFAEKWNEARLDIESLNMAIKALEQTKWIPVSERLPEIDEPVLIFQRYYSGANITIGRYHSDEKQGGYRYWQWIKYNNDFRYGIDHFGIICPDSYYVEAWMPLPELYKAESEVNNG